LTLKQIIALGDFAMKQVARGLVDPLLGVGIDREGAEPFGGPLWMDRDSLVPIPGIHQIVVYTPGLEVGEKLGRNSTNYCLDVRNGAAAALMSEGRLAILSR